VTPERIDALYESVLRPRLAELEALRLRLRGQVVRGVAVAATPPLLAWIAGLAAPAEPAWLDVLITAAGILGFFAGFVVAILRYAIPGFTAWTNYRGRYKQEVVGEVFRRLFPDGDYAPGQGIPEADFDAPGIFVKRGAYRSEDRMRGSIAATPFEAAEVRRSYSTGGKNSTTVVIFHGLFFQLDYRRRLRGTTLVLPHAAEDRQLAERRDLRPVEVGDEVFAAAFKVLADDQAEALDVLGAEVRQRILALEQAIDRPLFLAFMDRRACVGVQLGRPLFEPTIATAGDKAAVRDIANAMVLVETVVAGLDLNAGLAAATEPPAFLARADDAAARLLDDTAAKGKVDEAALWRTATSAAGEDGFVEDDGPASPPAGTRIRIARGPAMLAVDYPLGFGFWLAVGLSLAGALLAWATLPAVLALLGFPGLGDRLPPLPAELPPALAVLIGHHPAWGFVAACLVGWPATLGWLLRVRRVTISGDAIRVSRGFRPWPRAYPRPLYGRVLRLKGAVYIGRSEGLNLLNPTASPMLREAEARWVAATLGGALKAIPPARGRT
jgi:hypothetical protein